MKWITPNRILLSGILRGALARADQVALLALDGVPAPPFATRDLDGASHRLADHSGDVVLVKETGVRSHRRKLLKAADKPPRKTTSLVKGIAAGPLADVGGGHPRFEAESTMKPVRG